LAEATHVLAMTSGHAAVLAARYAGYGPTPEVLGGPGGDLDDPIGGDVGVYRECARAIVTHLERHLPAWLGGARRAKADMKIALGNDHRGVGAKQRVMAVLTQLGHESIDLGVGTSAGVDYPDYAIPVAEAVATGTADRGILICATGHGMCIAANKVHGVRAANCRDLVDAEMSRLHNDANVMCLSADLISEDAIERMVRTWLETKFEGGRHARRLDKITQYEKDHGK
jgi:ribose 5-phosphate isomerase B